jgi:hypothetical protein
MVERVLSSVGKLGEARSIFKESLDVSNAGVLWSLPALLSNGLLVHAKDKFSLPQGFYGVIHIFLLLAYMALSRVKTTEQIRYKSAGEWGLLLGLDRIPEVQTLRKKIKHLTESGQVEEWSSKLSKEWMEAEPEASGTLYVDGHVRVYHGAQTKLPRRYVSRERLCLRGITDYWVNDQYGRPFFVISTEFTSGLLEMLRHDIVPRLLQEVPGQPSCKEFEDDPYLSRFTLVFDREGYSPEFFKEMWEKYSIACLTYNKYPKEDWPSEEFHDRSHVLPNGENVIMKISERGTYIGTKKKGMWVREVRKLTNTGHQTSVLSTEFKSEATNIGLRMFARWSQENFFKYMMEHFNIDALMDYKKDEIDETKKVVNPDYRKLESEIKSKAGKLGRSLRRFAEMSLSSIPSPDELEKYEIKKGELTSKHILLSEMPEKDRFSQLGSKRKHFIDTIKMIAYRAETAMVAILRESLTRTDDARSLLRDIFTSESDIVPNEKEQTLTIKLHHLTNRLSDKAALHLSDYLNKTETIYPGTNMRLVYELVS